MGHQEYLAGLYEKGKQIRNKQYPEFGAASVEVSTTFGSTLDDLNRDGFSYLKGALSKEDISALKKVVGDYFASGTNVTPPRIIVEDGNGGMIRGEPLTDTQLQKGTEYYRDLVHWVAISDPLINCRYLVGVALGDQILDIANAYLGCFPGLGFLKLMRSFVNQIPDFDTQEFHVDGNASRMMKAFIYLNDVDELGGPTTYVKGSHRNRFPGWEDADRFTLDEMISAYGEESIVPMTGAVGDIILADTTGFHRGAKPVNLDRDIVILNYVIHEEYGGGGVKSKIKSSDFNSLTAKQKAAADFLEVAPG